MSEIDKPDQPAQQATPILWSPGHNDDMTGRDKDGRLTGRIHEQGAEPKQKRAGKPEKRPKLKDKSQPSLRIVDVSRPDALSLTDQEAEKFAAPRYSVAFSEIPHTERPRERFIAHGAEALSVSELIALLLRTGSAQRNVTALAEHILSELGSLARLAEVTTVELESIDGIGLAKAIEIKAALELGKRVCTLTPEERPTITGPRDVSNLLQSELRYLKKETLKSILLDAKNRVIAIKTVSIGDLTSSIVHPREVYRDAIVNSAASIIVAHNHPSGDPTPSTDDVNITRRLIAAGETIGIDFLDHIVIGDDKFVSLKEKGLI